MGRADSISALGNLERIIKMKGTVGTEAVVEKFTEGNQELDSES